MKPDLTKLIEWWVGEGIESPAFALAIRTWARSEADVENVMHRVDKEWINLVQLLFDPGTYDKSERLVLYFHQVGYQALALREKHSERLRLLSHYYKVLTGHEPDDGLRNALCAHQRREAVPVTRMAPASRVVESVPTGRRLQKRTRSRAFGEKARERLGIVW